MASSLRIRSTAPMMPIAIPTTRTKGRMTALQCIEESAHRLMIGPGKAAIRKPSSPTPNESPRRSPSSVSNMRTIARIAATAPTAITAREAQRQLISPWSPWTVQGPAKVTTPKMSNTANSVNSSPTMGCAFGFSIVDPPCSRAPAYRAIVTRGTMPAKSTSRLVLRLTVCHTNLPAFSGAIVI